MSAEVARRDPRIVHQVGGRAEWTISPVFEHVAPNRPSRERPARSARPAGSRRRSFARGGDDPEDLADDQRGETEARLVEHQQARPGHQGAAERQHLALAARQGRRELATALARRGKRR